MTNKPAPPRPPDWDEMSDSEKARFFRADMMECLDIAVRTMNQANAEGLVIQFNISRDSLGRFRVADLTISKVL